MALHEPIRSSIYIRLEELLGPDEAAALMQQFPNYDVTDVVTTEKLDLRLAGTEQRLHAEMSELRGGLQAEMSELRIELRTEMAGIIERLAVQEAKLDLLRTTIPDTVLRQLLFWLVPVIISSIGVSVTLAKLVS